MGRTGCYYWGVLDKVCSAFFLSFPLLFVLPAIPLAVPWAKGNWESDTANFVWRCISFCCYSLGFAVLGRSGLGLVLWLSGVGLAWDFSGIGIPRHTLYTCSTPVDSNVQEQRDGTFGSFFWSALPPLLAAAAGYS